MNFKTLSLLSKNGSEAKRFDRMAINDLIRKAICNNWVKFSRPIYLSFKDIRNEYFHKMNGYCVIKDGLFYNDIDECVIKDDFFYIYPDGICNIVPDAPEEYVEKFGREFCELLKKGGFEHELRNIDLVK